MIRFKNKPKFKFKKKLKYNLSRKISLWEFLTKMVITFYKKKKFQKFKNYSDF